MGAKRVRSLVRRVSSLGRVLVALVVLVGVWLLAYKGLEQATRQEEDRRLADRAALAKGYADLVRPWFEAARNEALGLVPELVPAQGREAAAPVIDNYLRSKRDFGQEVVLVGPGNRVVSASGGTLPANSDVRPCTTTEGDKDGGFTQLIADARAGARDLRVVHVPWDCASPRVASPEVAGANVIVVLAPLAVATDRLGPPDIGTIHVELLDGDFGKPVLDKDGKEEVAPSDRELLVRGARGKAVATQRYPGVVAAFADAGHGWGVTVEQGQGSYDGAGPPRLATWFAATVVAAALAVAFILLAFFDNRRRRVYRRAEEAKHAFFATVGHELRTPLTVLRGYSETLTARWDVLDDAAKEMLVSSMAPQAQRLGGLVEKLLLASNIQAEAYIRPVARPTEVSEILQKVAERFRPLAPLHTFVVAAQPGLPDAQADPDALEKALYQLVENAVKYSPSGGRVSLDVASARKGVEIAVSDDGVGLPQNVRDIFEPLVQGEAVDTRLHDEGGAGVGLFIVRTLINDMGGSVRAEPRSPAGSRFVVTLRATKTTPVRRAVTV